MCDHSPPPIPLPLPFTSDPFTHPLSSPPLFSQLPRLLLLPSPLLPPPPPLPLPCRYPGGLKETVAKQLHSRDPTQVLRKAVSGMLPKNNLRKKWLRHLHLFPTEACCSSLLTPHSSLVTSHSSLVTRHSSLLTPLSSLITTHSSLLTRHFSNAQHHDMCMCACTQTHKRTYMCAYSCTDTVDSETVGLCPLHTMDSSHSPCTGTSLQSQHYTQNTWPLSSC